jgi:predicted naringenin-chalcone synthase
LSYITAIETAVPEYCHTQGKITSFYENSTSDLSVRRKIRSIASKAEIDTRYSVLSDFSNVPEDFTFFSKNSSIEPEPTLTQRMACFKTEALQLSLKAIRKIKDLESTKSSITHIITVTCTGLFTPGLDVEIIKELDLSPFTQRSSVNFMGCNAAILALNSANSICNSIPNSKVLIVCVELCTIHFQKNYSDDYILSTALFGDGCAAVMVESNSSDASSYNGLLVKSFNSLLIHKGHQEMAWQITEKGFIMNLTSYVSEMINGSMKEFLNGISLDKHSIDYWAIHPGGKRILDDFSETLDIDKTKLYHSYDVLKRYGNMSSPTVLFVLKQVIESNERAKKGETIFSAAFGPGLSIETMQLQYV